MTTTTDPSRGRAERPAADHLVNPVDVATVVPAGGGSVEGLAHRVSTDLLGLRVQHPAVGVCVVAVEGELDMLTAPVLEACVDEQLASVPRHLILDLQSVCFLGSRGLNCLLQARELAQSIGAQLHLAGLVTRAVARPLEVTGLRERFDTYPRVAEALSALTSSTEVWWGIPGSTWARSSEVARCPRNSWSQRAIPQFWRMVG